MACIVTDFASFGNTHTGKKLHLSVRRVPECHPPSARVRPGPRQANESEPDEANPRFVEPHPGDAANHPRSPCGSCRPLADAQARPALGGDLLRPAPGPATGGDPA